MNLCGETLTFLAKDDIGFMGKFKNAIYGYLGIILRPIFSSDTHIYTTNWDYVDYLTAAISNF